MGCKDIYSLCDCAVYVYAYAHMIEYVCVYIYM